MLTEVSEDLDALVVTREVVELFTVRVDVVAIVVLLGFEALLDAVLEAREVEEIFVVRLVLTDVVLTVFEVVGADGVLDCLEVFEAEVVDAREVLDGLVDPVDTDD